MPDLFSILCTTCQTKLRVRDPAVVGQILACPKCSSMVLVQAPPGWAPPLTGEVPSATPSGSNGNGSGHQESTILKKPSATPTPKPVARPAAPTPAPARRPADASMKETASDSHFADVEALFGGDASKPAPAASVAQVVKPKAKAAESSKEKRRNTPAPPPPPAELGPPPVAAANPKPAIDPVPVRTKRVRMLALLTIGGLMGISLAISAAYFAATWTNQPKEVVQVSPLLPDPGPADPVDPKPAVPSRDPSDDPPPSEPMETEPSPPDEPPVAPAETDPPQETRDPLDIVNDKARNDDPADLRKLENQFKDLEADAGPAVAEATTSEEPATEAPTTPEEPAASPSRSRPEPRVVDLAARLADRVVEVEFTGQKLADVLQFLSDFSTIPITLDPDALAWSKITPAAPVNVKLVNATVEEVLAEVLKPFRLEAQKLENQLVVTRSAAVRKIKSPIDDLTGGDAAKGQQLIELISAWLRRTPGNRPVASAA